MTYYYNHGTVEDRLASRIGTPDANGCIPWTGVIDRNGYGKSGPNWAHRRVWEVFVGPIPAKLTLDHLCRNRACVNPDHLEPVSHQTNLHRSPLTTAGRTECRKGHPYSKENTYIVACNDGYTRRKCRVCQLAAMAVQRAKNKERG